MSDENYKELEYIEPFKYQLLQAFPFIADDFDQLTAYGLFCKLSEKMNEVVSNNNNLNDDMLLYIQKFNTLKNYVDTYFEDLNVQEEINEKLNAMAEDGTLLSLIEPYLRVIFVDSTSDMVDNNRIYVLSTNNHIYQYNTTQESFIDTGVEFGSVGTVLTPVSSLVTSNNYATNLADLNDALDNTIYSLLFSKGSNKPANMPVDGDSKIDVLYTIKTNTSKKQIYVTNEMQYTRYKYMSGNWTPWTAVTGTYPIVLTNSNYTNYITNLNDIDTECSYVFLLQSSTPTNYPVTPSGDLELLITKKVTNSDTLQQLFFSRYEIYTRRKYNNSWSAWNKITGNRPTRIQDSNYASLLPDLNGITENSVYSLLFASNTESKPANLPVNPSGNIEMVETFIFSNSSGAQVYYTQGDMYYRYKYNGTWRNWYSLKTSIATTIGENYDVPKIIHVGANQTYTTLKSAVEYAVQYANTTVIVEDGTYDLYEEFGGDTFFDSYDSNSSKGLTLSNGIHLIFSSNAKVVFNNENENTAIDSRFSPFNSGSKGFTIENLHLECSRCRYAIHDERGGSTERYRNIIKNSYIKHDNTNGGFTQTIGGGLGKAGEIIIENCEIVSPNASDSDGVVSYHNNNSSTDTASKSNVIIKDNYFTDGTIRVSWCGVSTLITNFLITNNKLNSTIIHAAERSGTDTIENTSITKWNNIES